MGGPALLASARVASSAASESGRARPRPCRPCKPSHLPGNRRGDGPAAGLAASWRADPFGSRTVAAATSPSAAPPSARFDRALASLRAANAADPTRITWDGASSPRELVHGELLGTWSALLAPLLPPPPTPHAPLPDAGTVESALPGELLALAARGQHIRRWEVLRSAYPEGKAGYMAWRTGLYAFHARTAAALVTQAGYPAADATRVSALINKTGRKYPCADPEAQALEDGLCLIFLQTGGVGELLAKVTDEAKMVGIVRKTWAKMSGPGREEALKVCVRQQAICLH